MTTRYEFVTHVDNSGASLNAGAINGHMYAEIRTVNASTGQILNTVFVGKYKDVGDGGLDLLTKGTIADSFNGSIHNDSSRYAKTVIGSPTYDSNVTRYSHTTELTQTQYNNALDRLDFITTQTNSSSTDYKVLGGTSGLNGNCVDFVQDLFFNAGQTGHVGNHFTPLQLAEMKFAGQYAGKANELHQAGDFLVDAREFFTTTGNNFLNSMGSWFTGSSTGGRVTVYVPNSSTHTLVDGAIYEDSEGNPLFTAFDDATTAIVDGVEYVFKSIVESVESAATAVGEFIQDLAASGTQWFSSGGAQTAFSSWLSQNVDDILTGDMNGSEAIISLGQYMAGSFLSNYVVNDLLSANIAVARVLYDDFNVGKTATSVAPAYQDAQGNWHMRTRELKDANGNVVKDANGDPVLEPATEAGRYAGAFAASLTQMALVFVTSGFDAGEAAKVGVATLAGELAKQYLVEAGLFGKTSIAAGAVATAVMTAVQGLLDFDGDWGQLGLQVGTAVGIYFATKGVVSVLGLAGELGTLPLGIDPATIIAGIIVSFIASKVIGSLFGAKKFGIGEFDNAGKLLNSIYQVQTVVIDGVAQEALVAVHPQGSTIIASTSTLGYILGSSGADVLVGGVGTQTLSGNAGSDYLEGRMGDDNLLGGDGNDHLVGGEGNDVVQGDGGEDILFGDADDDTVVSGAGDDLAHGGTGNDIMSGGAGRDYILAAGDDDAVSGDNGDDVIDGGYGDDSLLGGAGHDLMLGNFGNDHIEGEDGDDTIFGDDGNDQVFGGSGNDFIEGGDGNDILQGDNGTDLISAGADDDYAEGGLGDDNILGGTGNDVLLGGMDDDYLAGEAGDDSLSGGFGNDIMIGGVGENTLDGGDGNDVFVIGSDTLEADNVLLDSAGTDSILLSWMSDTQANADLDLLKDGDDLEISYNGRVLATVTDHFVSGNEIEKIELSSGKYIDLSAVTYNGGTGVGTFTTATLASGSVAALPGARAAQIDETFLTQDGFFNSAFLDALSVQAYNEILANDQGYAYYDGTQLVDFKRARGKLGGHYTVYKLNQPGSFDGTDTNQTGYAILDTEDQAAAAPFFNDSATLLPDQNDSTIAGATIHYTTYGADKIQDIIVGGTVVSSKLAGSEIQYAAGATIAGVTYATRMASGTDVTSALAVKNLGNDLLVGAYWNETINGKSGDDVIVGNTGNDSLLGGTGNDWLFGGDDQDTLNGQDGDDLLFGGAGNDSVLGGNGEDAMFGGAGTDTIIAGANDDWAEGGADNDSIEGNDGNDVLFGGEGNDTIYGNAGNDVLHGNEGHDSLYGGAGNDTLYSSLGDDILLGGDDEDILAGPGLDLASYYDSTAAVSINLATNVNAGGYAEGDQLFGIDVVDGSTYNDTIVGAAANERFKGWEGNDSLNGGDGNDTLIGGAGADTLNGGNGRDTASYIYSTAGVVVNMALGTQAGGEVQGDVLSNIEDIQGSTYGDTLTGAAGDNYISGGEGNDSLGGGIDSDTLEGGAGADSLDGGGDRDWASYANSAVALTLDLTAATQSGGEAQGDVLTSIENLIGTGYNDTLIGNSSANELHGGAGWDYLRGGAGADTLVGGDGIDFADYTASSAAINVNLSTNTHTGGDAAGDSIAADVEHIFGTAYNDTIVSGSGANYLRGYAGADSLVGGDGNDEIEGGDGADTLDGGNGIDFIDYYSSTAGVNINLTAGTASGGHAAGDVISGFENVYGSASYSDTITGTTAANYFYGYAGNDSLTGGDGNDSFWGAAGADTLAGGNDIDVAYYYSSSAAVNVNLTLATSQSGGDAAGDILSDIEYLAGSSYNDTLTGTTANNYLWGNDGNDSITAGDGLDSIEGGAGADTAYGGNGVDSMLGGAGNDSLFGDAGDDVLMGEADNDYLSGGAGADLLDGGAGLDWAYYQTSLAAVAIDLTLGTASGGDAVGDTLSGIEYLYGSTYNDTLTGDLTANYLHGNDGNDSLKGGAGADTIDGGNGTDGISYAGSQAINVNLSVGTAQAGGDAAGDILSNLENLIGSSFADVITGTSGNNVLEGGAGDDIINGGAGNDTILGGADNEYITGGAGADSIDGGSGTYDVADYSSATAAVKLDMVTTANGSGDAAGDILVNIEYIYGSSYNDTMVGDAGNTYFRTLNGNDSVTAGDGDDRLDGGAGADTLTGGNGTDIAEYYYSTAAVNVSLALATSQAGGWAAGDILSGIENVAGSDYNDTLVGTSAANLLWGGEGNDYLTGGAGADTLTGNGGSDLIYYDASSAAVSVDLTLTTAQSGGDAAGDILSSIEHVVGSAYNDTVVGTTDANTIYGLAGADSITAGDGDDYIDGGAGADTLSGGNGTDWLDYYNSTSGVTVDLGTNSASGGEAQGDVISGFEYLYGSLTYADTLTGNSAANLLNGRGGNDSLYGGDGNDTLYGGTGADSLTTGIGNNSAYGEDGADIIFADSGNDLIYGDSTSSSAGDGNDTIIGYGGSDTLYGGGGTDYFCLAGSDGADTVMDFQGAGTAGGDLVRLFSSTGYTTWASLSGHISYSGGNALITLSSGNVMTLIGVTSLVSGDFYFG